MLLTETRAAEQLREEGYTVLRGVLDVEQDIEPLIEEYGESPCEDAQESIRALLPGFAPAR